MLMLLCVSVDQELCRNTVFRSFWIALIALACTGTSVAGQAPDAETRTLRAVQNGEAAPLLTLGAVLDSVARTHPLVEASQARVRAARGSRRAAGAFANPFLGYDVENGRLPGGATPTMAREVMTTVTLPLEELYQRGPRVRRAGAELRAAQADAAATRQQLALDAARAYFRTALAKVELDASREVAAWLDTVVAYNRSRVREGVTAEADLIRSEVERDRAGTDAVVQEAELARSSAELAAFLGDPGNTTTVASVALEEDALPLPASVSTGALISPPTVQAARERASAASAGVGAERSMFLRQLGATVGTKQTEGISMLVAGVSLPVPLFDQNRGQRERATADRDVAQLELVAEQRAASAALVGAERAAELLTARTAAVGARDPGGRVTYLARAEESRRIALGAYREGAIPLFQVIDAIRASAEARVAYYHLVYAQHEGVLALLVAQGTPLTSAAVRRGVHTNGTDTR